MKNIGHKTNVVGVFDILSFFSSLQKGFVVGFFRGGEAPSVVLLESENRRII